MRSSFQPKFGFIDDAGDEGVAAFFLSEPVFGGKAIRIDLAREFGGEGTKVGGEFAESGGADDEEVDVTVGGAGAGGDGSKDEGEVDAGDGVEGGAQAFGDTRGFGDDAVEFGVKGMVGVGFEIKPVAVATGEDEVGGGELGEFLLQGGCGESGVAGEIAEMDFAIKIRKKQAKDFRACFGEELVEEGHEICSPKVDDCLFLVNRISAAAIGGG